MGSRSPLLAYFGSEIRRDREAAGVTQRELAQATVYSESKVSAVERGEQLASPRFCELADEFLKTDGRYGRMRERLLKMEVYPEGFHEWPQHEREATSLWTYEALVVPGLLQTEAYARALLDNDDSKVAARLERQAVLTRDNPPPPSMVTLLNEQVLRYPVGDKDVARQQLEYLVEVGRRFVVQVIPSGARTYRHLDGAFVIATVDGREVVFVETPVRGFVLDSAEVVSRGKRQWDLIRAEALPTQQSIDLIQEVAGQWT